MTQITRKGCELADKLIPSYFLDGGTTTVGHVLDMCSLICRHAATHRRLQATACNRELTEREQDQDAHCEASILALVERLPPVNGQPIRVKFSGDPRACTVRLIMPDGRYDFLGGAEEGLGVPQD